MRRGRVLGLGITAIGVIAAAAGLLLVIVGLDEADKISSVVGGAAGLLGLLATGFGFWFKSRDCRSVKGNQPGMSAQGQQVAGSIIQGQNMQIGSVGGDLQIRDQR